MTKLQATFAVLLASSPLLGACTGPQNNVPRSGDASSEFWKQSTALPKLTAIC